MVRRGILIVLAGLLLLAGIPWLLAVRGPGTEDTGAQVVAGPSPNETPSGGREQIEGGAALAGTVHATVTDVSTSSDPVETQVHSGPRLYQLVVETLITIRSDAVLGASTDSAGRSGDYQGVRRTVLSRPAGDAAWELLVAAWVLLGAAWLLRGAGRRRALRK
jgi:hypothetical protein